MSFFKKRRHQRNLTAELNRAISVNQNLRKKIRNQKTQLKALNTAIIRKNYLISRRDEAIMDLQGDSLVADLTDYSEFTGVREVSDAGN